LDVSVRVLWLVVVFEVTLNGNELQIVCVRTSIDKGEGRREREREGRREREGERERGREGKRERERMKNGFSVFTSIQSIKSSIT
jgi:hypothetical protein